MTIQDQIDQIEKDILGVYKEIEVEIEEIKQKLRNSTKLTDSKPTRYYPNGAYMDEPEIGTPYWIKGEYSEVISSQEDGFSWDGDRLEMDRLERQEIFPTEESCKKDKRHDDLTAKMYRDMRDVRINGDWVPDIKRENVCHAAIFQGVMQAYFTTMIYPGSFTYKNITFISDLKALGWTEEELKIVWFNN